MLDIAIVEHHNLVRRGLVDLVSEASDGPLLRVVSVVAEPWQLDPAAPAPDVIILGPSPVAEKDLPDTVAELAPRGRILVVSDFTGAPRVAGALRAGAYGCVSRRVDDEELLLAVRTVARGGLHVSPGLAPKLHAELGQSTTASLPALARRERETLGWLASGLTHGQIARRMDLTEATVSTYVKRIKNKLNVGNKADLTRKAIELGLLHDGAA
ncbi:LuxR C-terminal-related transcriptional regulator [Streptomyces tsukubensis]|nr:response regulator transcription factor [Streptomyces tsukubensis]